MDIIELCFINGIQGRRRSRALAMGRGTLKPWPESVEGLFWGSPMLQSFGDGAWFCR